MDIEFADKFRPQLLLDPPDFTDRVNSPWENVPDFAEHNDKAYRRIDRALTSLHRASKKGIPSAMGVLVIGEAGTGKTHLLMRVAQKLSKKNHICFVRRPNNEEAVAQHIWANMLSSLEKDLHDVASSRSQLDDLLSHVFRSVLLPEFEKDVDEGKNVPLKKRWIKLLSADAYNIFSLLGEGEMRTKNLRAIRSRTLRHLQIKHPLVDQQIAGALLTYCFTSDERRRRIVLTWLSGQDIDSKEATSVGLPESWVPIGGTATERSVQQQREDHALRAIQTIGYLSTYHQPLILAFDQLEGLRGQELLTERWGDVTREIFTMAPNLLVVTCVFPSLWEKWFTEHLDESATQRISQYTVSLDVLDTQHAQQMLRKQLETTVSKYALPSDIYPFTSKDIREICLDCKTPRLFLQKARASFDSWLDEDHQMKTPEFGKENLSNLPTKSSLIKRAFNDFIDEQRENQGAMLGIEQDFYGRIRHIFKTLLRRVPVDFEKAGWSHFVMPKNFVIRSRQYGDAICIAVLNATGRSFTTRIKNLVAATRDGEQFKHVILIRNDSLTAPTEMGQRYLEEFRNARGRYVLVNDDELVYLNALYDTIVAIEERNLSRDGVTVDIDDFVRFVADSNYVSQSQLLGKAVELTASFRHAIDANATGERLESRSDEGKHAVSDELSELARVQKDCEDLRDQFPFEFEDPELRCIEVVKCKVDCDPEPLTLSMRSDVTELDQSDAIQPVATRQRAGSSLQQAESAPSIANLIAQGESTHCEFKSTLRINLHTGKNDKRMEHACMKTIAAFLNTRGGNLIIGVNDDGEALGLDNDKFKSEDKLSLHLVNLLKDRLGAQHSVHIEATIESISDKRVMIVKCTRSELPVYLKDGNSEQFFIRTGPATTELLPSQIQAFITQRF